MISHQLLLRAGFIKPVAAGIYDFLPLGYRVLEKLDRLIKEELSREGVQHLLMPIVHPSSLWQETGRRKKMDKILATFRSHHGGEYLIAPTHEETVTDLARNYIFSYKDLPVILNQNQWKYRDEVRVSGGLLRTREFLMQDAYSFDRDEAGLDASFQAVSRSYRAIFKRLGLEIIVVKADSGTIGGTGSEEFMMACDAGEDRIFCCDRCDYRANVEKAESLVPVYPQEKVKRPMRAVKGKGLIGVEVLAKFLGIPVTQTTKTLLYQVDERVVAVCLRGDYQVNEAKLVNYLGGNNLGLASAETVEKLTGAKVGYAGPINLPKTVSVIWDKSTQGRVNFECGANKTDFHNVNVNFGRDVKMPDKFVDIREIKAGEPCPSCRRGKLIERKTIELGHVFKLGTVYSQPMKALFTDAAGREKLIEMGCYGIGISRLLAAIVEQGHDRRGIIWPASAAPYQVHLIDLRSKMLDTSEIYKKLTEAGVEVLWDDRDNVSAGVKFADADLIGIPVRLVVSAKTKDKIEWKDRDSTKSELVDLEEVLHRCQKN